MRICAAQTRPIKGDIRANIADHERFVAHAVAERAQLIVFPELSLTGYEPTLAKELATDQSDGRFDAFQASSDANGITIGVGMPTKHATGICISLLLFQPRKPRCAYSKSHLHPDEEPFFVRGESSPLLRVNQTNVALAICYELSVPEHLESALKHQPGIYFASVAKFATGIGEACERLSGIARQCSMPVLMANCVGVSDGGQCAGHTSAWSDTGSLVGQFDDADAGLLILDTETQKAMVRTL